MRIVLYIGVIIFNATILFLLPQLMKKSTYIISLAISLGVLMILIPAGLYVTKMFLTSNREQQKTETVAATPAVPERNNELYESVHQMMAQKNYAVADALIDYAIISLGPGEHTAPEVVDRIGEIMTGKVAFSPPDRTSAQTTQRISKDTSDFIFIVWLSVVIVLIIALFVQLALWMVDGVLGFHTTYNAANLMRQPIKIAMENRGTIKSIITCFFFLASLLIFYGVVFKTKQGE